METPHRAKNAAILASGLLGALAAGEIAASDAISGINPIYFNRGPVGPPEPYVTAAGVDESSEPQFTADANTQPVGYAHLPSTSPTSYDPAYLAPAVATRRLPPEPIPAVDDNEDNGDGDASAVNVSTADETTLRADDAPEVDAAPPDGAIAPTGGE